MMSATTHQNWQTPGTADYAIREAIIAALEACHGRPTLAAQTLAVGRSTLYRWFKEMEIVHKKQPIPKRVVHVPPPKLTVKTRTRAVMTDNGGILFVPVGDGA